MKNLNSTRCFTNNFTELHLVETQQKQLMNLPLRRRKSNLFTSSSVGELLCDITSPAAVDGWMEVLHQQLGSAINLSNAKRRNGEFKHRN